MPEKSTTELMQSAAEKMRAGTLMTQMEVAALLDLSPGAIHKLDLPSIRLGRSLRFDPVDVSKLIASCREPALPYERHASHVEVVYFGMKYHDETSGRMGYMVAADPIERMGWEDVTEALCSGKTVTISPADQYALAIAEETLRQIKAGDQLAAPEGNATSSREGATQ